MNIMNRFTLQTLYKNKLRTLVTIIGIILSTAMFVTALGTAPCYAEEVTINFWHHYSEQSAENETLNDVLIPEFEKENPDIKVNAVSHEWSDLHEKILISAKSETLPDVARLDSAWVPEFEKMGILVPLNPMLAI